MLLYDVFISMLILLKTFEHGISEFIVSFIDVSVYKTKFHIKHWHFDYMYFKAKLFILQTILMK